jgi:hypothetical protein
VKGLQYSVFSEKFQDHVYLSSMSKIWAVVCLFYSIIIPRIWILSTSSLRTSPVFMKFGTTVTAEVSLKTKHFEGTLCNNNKKFQEPETLRS